MKVRDLLRLLEQDGWYYVRTKGSHHMYYHSSKPGLVVVPGAKNIELKTGTLNSILKQAGLKKARD